MAGPAVADPTLGSAGSPAQRVAGSRFLAASIAIAVIWLAVLVASVFSPNMITGSQHEQLAIAAAADWLWGSLATALLLLAAAFSRSEGASVWWIVALMTCAVWIAVGLASALAPSFVTGTDPTTIPVVAILAPIAGVVATAFLSVFAAGAASRPND